MVEIRNFINSKLKEIETLLKTNKEKGELIVLKNKYLDLIYLLKIYDKFNLNRKDIIEIIELPMTCTDTSEYRIMEDLDVESRDLWQEVKVNNNCLRLSSYDIIIKKK